MVLLGGLDFVDLGVNGVIVCGRVNIADYAEGDGEVRTFHKSEFELEGVVLAVCIVYENVVEGVAIFADCYDFDAKTILNEAFLVVFAEDHLLAVAEVDGARPAPAHQHPGP